MKPHGLVHPPGSYEAEILELAAAICVRELATQPDQAALLHLRSLLLSDEPGHLAAALACLRRAIALHPFELQFYLDLGAVLSQIGNTDQARNAYLRAATLAPNNHLPYFELGQELHRVGLLREAVVAYLEALRLRTDCAQTHFALADVLRRQGRCDEAIGYCQAGRMLDPDDPRGPLQLGAAYLAQGRSSSALDCFREASEVFPTNPDLYVGIGEALFVAGAVDESVKAYRTALVCDPIHEHASRCLARALDDHGCRGESANAWFHYGTVLQAKASYENAVDAFQCAVAAKPGHVPALAALVHAYLATGRPREALAVAHSVVSIAPDNARVHIDLATSHHLLGELDLGWDEWTSLYASQTLRRLGFEGRLWDGTALDGRTILLWTDMGRGDSIQFLRYIPAVKAQGGTVIVRCHHPGLVPLVERVPGVDLVITSASPIPHYDVHAPLTFFPAFYKVHRLDFGSVPFLLADPDLIDTWRSKLGPFDGLTIGLSWAGNAETLSASSRFVSLSALAPLGRIRGVRYISLQHGPQSAELLAPPAGLLIECIMDGNSSIDDAAAIVSNMDLVISVDTMIAHLAGALGVPVWTLLRYATNWRWGIEGDRTSWYPTMRLFRQARLGDWSGVFENVRDALDHLCQSARDGPTHKH